MKCTISYILVLTTLSLLVMEASCYSCPEVNVDFSGADLTVIYGVKSWQDCGKKIYWGTVNYSVKKTCPTIIQVPA